MSLAEAPLDLTRSVSELRSTVGDDELVVMLIDEVTDLAKKRRPRGGLTDAEARYLIDSGDLSPEELEALEREVNAGELAAQERRTRLEAVSQTFGTPEVATLLKIDESRVRHRVQKDGLFSFIVGRKRRFPVWQFNVLASEPLPHLATMVKALPKDWHPATVEGFMTAPKEDLRINGVEVSPAEWLTQGGDPDAVLQLLGGVLRS